MKVVKVQTKRSKQTIPVIDCFVDSGYLQGPGGQLPDVDVDYQSDKRQAVIITTTSNVSFLLVL